MVLSCRPISNKNLVGLAGGEIRFKLEDTAILKLVYGFRGKSCPSRQVDRLCPGRRRMERACKKKARQDKRAQSQAYHARCCAGISVTGSFG